MPTCSKNFVNNQFFLSLLFSFIFVTTIMNNKMVKDYIETKYQLKKYKDELYVEVYKEIICKQAQFPNY